MSEALKEHWELFSFRAGKSSALPVCVCKFNISALVISFSKLSNPDLRFPTRCFLFISLEVSSDTPAGSSATVKGAQVFCFPDVYLREGLSAHAQS